MHSYGHSIVFWEQASSNYCAMNRVSSSFVIIFYLRCLISTVLCWLELSDWNMQVIISKQYCSRIVYVCVCVCMCVYLCVFVRICAYLCIFVHICAYLCVFVRICAYLCVFLCISVYVCVFLCISVYFCVYKVL